MSILCSGDSTLTTTFFLLYDSRVWYCKRVFVFYFGGISAVVEKLLRKRWQK